METEYEVRVLDIDVHNLISKLDSLGATKKGEYFQRRYVYDFKPKIEGKWIRLRTNGEVTTLTIKDRYNDQSISGTLELEEKVEDFDKTHLILKELGYEETAYQENKRISYVLDDIELDIDTWPLIPTYLEIEGKSEESVKKYIELLGLQDYEITSEGVTKVYARYNVDLDSYKELKFEEGKNKCCRTRNFKEMERRKYFRENYSK